ncbi:MAG: hypothetical protein LBV12_05070 [Puniceicoccales bacterium]|nr:hypothetical protein [Puniceicoccales bacterium]
MGIVLIGGMVLEEEIPGFQMNWPRDILIVLGSAVVIPAFGWMQIALIPPILNIGSRGILIQHGQSTKLIVWDKIEKIRIEKSPLGYALLGINLRENSKVSVYGIASKIDTGTLIAFIEVHWTNKIEQSADISIPSEF